MKTYKRVGEYIFVEPIGKGAFAEVYECRHQQTNEKVAIKMVVRSEVAEQAHQIEKEIHVLKQLNHNNIVRMLDSQKTQKHYYLVFEYCQHGDFEHFINNYYGGKVPEYDAQKYIQQIIEGIKAIKAKKIVHRDLKLANILVNRDFELKIADFGLAQCLKNNDFLLKTIAGTPLNMDPLILEKKSYGEKCDIWSLGVIFYQILVGKPPFNPGRHAGINDLLELIRRQKVFFPENIVLSDAIKDLIRRMLVYDQDKRISFEELFSNEWITGKYQVPDPHKNLSSSKLLESVYSHRRFEGGNGKLSLKQVSSLEIKYAKNEKENKEKQRKMEKPGQKELILVVFLTKVYEVIRDQVCSLREEIDKIKGLTCEKNADEEKVNMIQALMIVSVLKLIRNVITSKTKIFIQISNKVIYEKNFQGFWELIMKNKKVIEDFYYRKEKASEVQDLFKLLQKDYLDLFDELRQRQGILTKVLKQNAEEDFEKLLLDCLIKFGEHVLYSEYLDDNIQVNIERYNLCTQICQFLLFARNFNFKGFSIDQFDDKENLDTNKNEHGNFAEVIEKCFEEGFSFKNIKEVPDQEFAKIRDNMLIISLREPLETELDLSLKSFEGLLRQRTEDLKERFKEK